MHTAKNSVNFFASSPYACLLPSQSVQVQLKKPNIGINTNLLS